MRDKPLWVSKVDNVWIEFAHLGRAPVLRLGVHALKRVMLWWRRHGRHSRRTLNGWVEYTPAGLIWHLPEGCRAVLESGYDDLADANQHQNAATHNERDAVRPVAPWVPREFYSAGVAEVADPPLAVRVINELTQTYEDHPKSDEQKGAVAGGESRN